MHRRQAHLPQVQHLGRSTLHAAHAHAHHAPAAPRMLRTNTLLPKPHRSWLEQAGVLSHTKPMESRVGLLRTMSAHRCGRGRAGGGGTAVGRSCLSCRARPEAGSREGCAAQGAVWARAEARIVGGGWGSFLTPATSKGPTLQTRAQPKKSRFSAVDQRKRIFSC